MNNADELAFIFEALELLRNRVDDLVYRLTNTPDAPPVYTDDALILYVLQLLLDQRIAATVTNSPEYSEIPQLEALMKKLKVEVIHKMAQSAFQQANPKR